MYITQNGKELDKSLYSIDIENKVFSSNEDNLVLDFKTQDDWTFRTSHRCTFYTNWACTFKTGVGCVFKTGSYCIFKTGSRCEFDTEYGCTFDTGEDCVFDTSWGCAFNTDSGCTFKTDSDCLFSTCSDCTLKTSNNCILLCYDMGERHRHFLDDSNYVFVENGLVEIKDKNAAILNMKHENELVRNLCKDILKSKGNKRQECSNIKCEA